MININDALQLIIERRTEIKEECIEDIKANPLDKNNFSIEKYTFLDQELANMKTKLIQLANKTMAAIPKPDPSPQYLSE